MTGKNVSVGQFLLSVIMALGLAIWGCGNDGKDGADGMDGMDGMDGQDGQDGKPGGIPPGPGDVVDISDPFTEELLLSFGDPLVAEITNVTVASPPVMAFTVSTAGGAAVIGLAPEGVWGTFAKLVPQASGLSRWVSYINILEEPLDPPAMPPSPNLLPQALQASNDRGGMLVDNGDGTYTYTFATDVANVTTPVPVAYDETLTHRAGLEIRVGAERFEFESALNPDNPTFTFVPNGSPVTDTREIVSTDTCNNCHGRLAIHGNGRFTTDYCVTCHNANSDQTGTRDQDFAELLDMPHMVHAIHAADRREKVQAGLCNGGTNNLGACEGPGDCPGGTCEGTNNFSYIVLGFPEGEEGGALNADDFSEVTFPQGLQSPLELLGCENCHKQSEETPDGDAWQTSSSATACGGCHVEGLRAVDSAGDPCVNLYDAACVDDTTGLSTYAFQHPPPLNALVADGSCANATCHGPGGAKPTAEVHRNLLLEEAAKYEYRIDSVANGLVCSEGSQVGNACMSDAECAPLTCDQGSQADNACASDAECAPFVCEDGDDVGDPCASDDDCTNGTCDTTPDGSCQTTPDGTCDQDALSIKFTVLNPIDMTTYDITADAPWDNARATLRFRVAWATNDYSNHDASLCDGGTNDGLPCADDTDCPGIDAVCELEAVGQPFTIDALAACPGATCTGPDQNDGSFTITRAITIPNITGDSIGIAMEGHPSVDVNGTPASLESIPVQAKIEYLNVDGIAPTPRRDVVDLMKCNNCHGVLSLHGENRTDNVQVCATCHNANATDIDDRGSFCVGGSNANSGCDPLADPTECPDGECVLFTGEATVDLKVMVHQIHAANTLITGRSLHDYTHVTYPRSLTECNACHLEGTAYPVDTTVEDGFRYATTTDSGGDLSDPEDDTNTTFNAATCGACHLDFEEPDALLKAHMEQNGAWFDATQTNQGVLTPDLVETCVVCHGEHPSGGGEE